MTTIVKLEPADACPICGAIPGEQHTRHCPREGAHFEVRLVQRDPRSCEDCGHTMSAFEINQLVDLCRDCAERRVCDIPPGVH